MFYITVIIEDRCGDLVIVSFITASVPASAKLRRKKFAYRQLLRRESRPSKLDIAMREAERSIYYADFYGWML